VKIVPLNSMVFVEQYDKAKRRSENNNRFISAVTSANLGVVKYSDHPEFPVGTMVYYGGNRESMVIEGCELFCMKAENILAKEVED
jgi:hypothetical protein